MKYHISTQGKPEKCPAKIKCRLGGESEHYNSFEEAQNQSDYINEQHLLAEEELSVYYGSDLMSTEELGNSNNYVSRIEAYKNGYHNPNILREDYLVKKELIKNNLYNLELMTDSDPYIADEAKKSYEREHKITLNQDYIDNEIADLKEILDENEKDEAARTKLAYLSKLSNSNSNKSNLKEIVKDISQPDGGATFNPITETSPTNGFCYSPYPEVSEVISKDVDLTKDLSQLENFIKKNENLLKKDDHYVGFWNDPATGIIYLDVSINTMDSKHARIECEKNDQIAYFDLQTFESVTVNPDATSGQKE